MNSSPCAGDPIPDILFVFPPSPRKYDFAYHLGAGYIRSYLQQHHIETAQFITSHERTVPCIISDILQYNPEIVGFTCYDANYPYVRLLARYLKKKNPHVRVILGGPTATFSPQVIMNHTPEIDLCIKGEGEETTLELLQKGFEDLENIQGITFRSHNEIISTPPRPLISSKEKGAELDVLPSPYLSGLIPPDGKTGILTGRGCVYHCTYCNFSTMFNHTIRYHSVERVIAELELIASHWNPQTKEKMMIHDDIFSLNLERAKTVCQKIIDKGIHVPLSLETRADNCDKELIELMRDAGVRTINFGLESASRTVLKTIKKAPNEEKFLRQIKTAVQWAGEAGIKTSVSIILGLPREGPKEAKETLDFVKELNVDECYHNVLFLFAGTELFRTRKKYGLKVAHSPTFLPYETKYTYDADKVEPLPNAGLHNQIKVWKKTYCDVLSYRAGGKAYTYLIVRKMPQNMTQLCSWLHNLCALHLSVVDMTENIGKKEVGHRITSLLEGGVPVGFYSVVTGEGRSRMLKLHSQMELNAFVPEIPFCQWEKGLEELVTLEREKDVEGLAQLLDAHTKNGVLSFSAQDVPKMVVDACKWGKVVCPALSRGVLVVDGDDVLSCYHGGCIGKVGDDMGTLRENMEDFLGKREKERGCEDCEVKNECSHCLFPYSFTDNEFCELKKKYPYVSKVIPLLEWLYVYSGRSDAVMMFRMDEKAPPLFYRGEIKKGEPLPEVRDTVHLVSFGGNAFACTGTKSFSLDPVKAAILEACELGVGKESLIFYLEKEHGSTFIDDVLYIFGELGFLNC